MRLLLRFILSLLLLPTASLAEKPVVPAPAPKAEVEPSTFLWKVTGKDGRSAHVLGSIHMGDDSMYPLPQVMEDAFAGAEVVAVEADVGKDPAQLKGLIMRVAMLSDGSTLPDHLPKKLYARLLEEGAREGLPIPQFSGFKPWFVAMTMAAKALQRAGIRPDRGIEHHFLGKARGTKPIVELEGAAYQMNLLDSLDDKQSAAFLEYTLDGGASIAEDTSKIMSMWKRGDVAAVDKLLNEELRTEKDLEGLYEAFFSRRNREMTQKIDGYLKSGKHHFVIVGAAHTVGPDGVIALLKKRGYQAQRF